MIGSVANDFNLVFTNVLPSAYKKRPKRSAGR